MKTQVQIDKKIKYAVLEITPQHGHGIYEVVQHHGRNSKYAGLHDVTVRGPLSADFKNTKRVLVGGFFLCDTAAEAAALLEDIASK